MRNGKLMTTRVAAIALSSMMVLSPLTAFASSSTPNPAVVPTPWGNYIQNETSGFLTEKGGYIAEGSRIYKATFKKSLALRNVTNSDFVPSVPDVQFNYSLAPATKEQAEAKSDHESGATPSYNGASVFPGTADQIATKEDEDLFVKFSSGDNADTDWGTGNDAHSNVMTKLVSMRFDESKFDGCDPGVYRFVLAEESYVDLDQTGKEETKTDPEDVKDDVNKVDDAYKYRFVDIAIGREDGKDITDPTRKIQGIILHEVIIKEGEGTKYKIGKTDGFTPDSYPEDHTKKTETETPLTYSEYVTYDIVIGKELTGDGVTDVDLGKKYEFDITLSGPVNTTFETWKSFGGTADPEDDTNTANKDTYWKTGLKAKIGSDKLGEDTTANIKVGLYHDQFIVISGLPAGTTYTIKETNGEGFEIRTAKDDADGIKNAADIKDLITDLKLQDDFATDSKIDTDVEKKNDFIYVKKPQKADDLIKASILNASEGNKYDAQTGLQGTIAKRLSTQKDQSAFIINEKAQPPMTGVIMNVAPYALMVIAAAIFAGLFISKKHREEEI